MLSETKLSLLQQLVHNASSEEIIWTKGYLAGYLDGNNISINQKSTVASAIAVKPLILYGTETGNSKKVASQILTSFKKNKIQAKAVDVFQYDFTKLEKESLLLFIVSTQGEGEFPQNAQPFFEKLSTANINLSHINFAVFGLGDSSYPLFCNAGILLDETLEKKGAKRLLPLVKADVDYAQEVIAWEKNLQNAFQNQTATPVEITKVASTTTSHKKNYTGQISHKVILNDTGSNKETYHIEITSNDEVQYEPGDALGIVPKNNTVLVNQILAYFGEDGTREITIKDKTASLQELLSKLNIKGLSKKSIDQITQLFGTTTILEKADLIDVLRPIKSSTVAIESVIALLLPIAPRLYSIASSPEAHDGQVHLTVNLATFKVGDEIKTGLASQFLADYPTDTEIEFYIHKNQNFRLPSDDTDVIMIGPGTGIAPFRSFLAHRDATGADGKNWLFFGEQHFVTDFYYQTEIQEWITTGLLTNFDAAFSRDQKEKIYVQDRIRQKEVQFNQWLENGASLYICGQKNPMSTDVEKAIIDIIATQRNISIEAATEILNELETNGKYQKDVY